MSAPIVEAAEALAPRLAERASEIEAARRLPPDVSTELARAGFYRMWAPEKYGGLEVDPASGARALERLAIADAACGWVAFIGATSATVLAQVPEDAARDVFPDPETLIAGVFAPMGVAERRDGGFRANGRWQWGSGTQNAKWVLGGCRLVENGEPMRDPDGVPRAHMLLFPAESVEFLDTWHSSGLRGTGSTDFQVTDVDVPDVRVVGYPKPPKPDRPLYRFPQFTFLALGIAAVALGAARGSIDDLLEIAVGKRRSGARKTVAESALTQIELARAEARLRSARAFYFEAIDAAWEIACRGDSVPVGARRDIRLATTHAVQESVAVVDAMYNLGGGTSVYQSSSLQRRFRDVHVATQHIMVGSHTLETVGRLFLGIEAKTSTL